MRETVIDVLRERPGTRFTIRDLSEELIRRRPEAARVKLERTDGLVDSGDLLQQVIREASGDMPRWRNRHPEIQVTDGRPRRFYWFEGDGEADVPELQSLNEADEPSRTEADLYPILGNYLRQGPKVLSMRIDERRGKKSAGAGANRWLYPDLIGMEVLSDGWLPETKLAAEVMGARRVRLWSFEVKLSLGVGTLREAFFQTVSNSSWANFGYLVAAEVQEGAEAELRMLSSLHGIGVILLDAGTPGDSQILLPARERFDVDWNGLDRLAAANGDAETVVQLVRQFHQTGDPRDSDWRA